MKLTNYKKRMFLLNFFSNFRKKRQEMDFISNEIDELENLFSVENETKTTINSYISFYAILHTRKVIDYLNFQSDSLFNSIQSDDIKVNECVIFVQKVENLLLDFKTLLTEIRETSYTIISKPEEEKLNFYKVLSSMKSSIGICNKKQKFMKEEMSKILNFYSGVDLEIR
jgi:hypothetical protein